MNPFMTTLTAAKFKKALALRESGDTVLKACKKAGLPVPTFYYQLKRTVPAGRGRAKRAEILAQPSKPALSGFELRRLRTAASRIQKLGREVERLLSKV